MKQKPPPQVSQAPDLRRWSAFMNPFPHVRYGGYTDYYKSQMLHRPQFQLPQLCQLNSLPPPHGHSVHHKSGRSQTSTIQAHSDKKARPRKLSVISETTSLKETISNTLTIRSATPSSQVSSQHLRQPLRRRKRRLLRTPSVERDFPAQSMSPHFSQAYLDRSHSTSSTATRITHVSLSSTGARSYQSTAATTYSDMPLTPDDNEAFHYTPRGQVKQEIKPLEPDGDGALEGEHHDPFERPDSRSTFYTALSQLPD